MTLYDCMVAVLHFVQYTAAKPKGPVRKNTISGEVAAPTYKRGFVTPKFWGLVRLHRSLMVTGRGGAYPQGLPHDSGRVLNHHAPPAARKNANGGLPLLPGGAKTMTASSAIRATSPALGNLDPIQLHAQAHNALSMALYYLRDADVANVPAARRKAVQALAALRDLTSSLEG